MGLPAGAKVYNVVRANMDSVYMNTLPSATADNIASISNILFGDGYQPALNDFVNTLINRIGLTIIRNKSFNNPLGIFKKGSMPLGSDVQEIYENPGKAEQYEYSNTAMAKLLSKTDPDTKVAYYRVNRKDLYTKTITREGLQAAFVSWEKFEDYINSITNSLYSGNYIDEFNYTKDVIEAAYNNNKAIIKTVSAVTSDATAKAFIKAARSTFTKMRFPSTEFNAWTKFENSDIPVTTWTEPDRIVFITTADIMAEIDVDVLAAAFNMDKADFLGRVIIVDKFKNSAIQGILCDEAWLQIYDNIFRFDEFYNARTLSWNLYLHSWSIYSCSPIANAVIFATAESVPATAITLSESSLTIEPDATDTFTISLTPINATSSYSVYSDNESVAEITDITSGTVTITGKDEGTATITVKTDNGLTKTLPVTVAEAEVENGEL